MAFVHSYNAALQVLAAFVIFVFGYIAFFALLAVCLLITAGLYKSAQRIRAWAARSVSATGSILNSNRALNRWWGTGNLLKQSGGSR